jgi:hypothetical protein
MLCAAFIDLAYFFPSPLLSLILFMFIHIFLGIFYFHGYIRLIV